MAALYQTKRDAEAQPRKPFVQPATPRPVGT